MRVADQLTGMPRRGERHLPPAALAVLIAAVLLADGAVVLSRSTLAPPPPPAAAPRTAAPPPVEAPAAPAPAGQLRLSVPALGVDSAAVSLRIGDDGTLEVPRTARDVGWYAGSAVPGEIGPAVFAGHVDLDGRRGVFSGLAAMRAGDVVEVVRPDGQPVSFVVTRVEQHAKDSFPTTAVYGPTDAPELRLVTCGGSFDRTRGSYRDNVIVFGVLAA